MIIQDKTIEPFFIECDRLCCTVKKKFLKGEKSQKQGEEAIAIEGFFSNPTLCLYRIRELKAIEGEETIDLDEYISRIQSVPSISVIE